MRFLASFSQKRTKVIKNLALISFDGFFIEILPLLTLLPIEYQVLQLQIKTEKLLDRALQLTTGNQSQLNKLLQSGDMPQAVQLAKAVIAAVDEKIPQDQLKETRKAVSVQTLSHSIPHCSIGWREGVLRLVSFFKFSLNTE